MDLRADVRSLEGKYPGVARDTIVDCAVRLMRWREAEADLAAARQERAEGRGRRPSAKAVGALQKRAALEAETLLKFEARLAELAARHAPAPARPSAADILASLPPVGRPGPAEL